MIKSSGETYIFLLLLVCAGNCWANDVNLFGVRPAISQTGSITDAIDYNFFISTRVNLADVTVNGVENPVRDMLFYAQPSIVYKYSPQLSFAASYVFQRTNPFDREFSNEHRVFQQTVYSVPVFTGNFYQRARFEERFIINRNTDKAPLSTRLRYMVGYNFPFQGKRLDSQEFYFNIYNEFYFSTTGQRNAIYSENWLYAGIGYATRKKGNIEIGPLLITSVINDEGRKRNFLLLQILWSANFDFFR